MQFTAHKDLSFRTQVQADSRIAGMEETHQILRENIMEVQGRWNQYTCLKEKIFAVGD